MKKSKILFAGIGLFVFMSSFFVFSSEAEAKNSVNFSQSILPVKFVYLNDKKQIRKVWSNTRETDSVYVVKFFSDKDKKELAVEKKLLAKFKKASIKQEVNNNLQSLRVDFIESEGSLEEIHTFV